MNTLANSTISASSMLNTLTRQREFFASGATQASSFRLEQLEALEKLVTENTDKICDECLTR